jgi:NAD(P)-dependent dehydrogenase (short-subunit alcohol dehydrogenase family)
VSAEGATAPYHYLAPLPKDTVAVVAGGSSGMGRAAAEALARAGATVELVAIDEDGVARAERELTALGLAVRGSVADAADEAAVEGFFAGVDERHGRLGVLVNSVGIQHYGTVETTTAQDWDRVLAVNVRSMFLMARHAVPLMRRNGGGSIVHISSVQAYTTQRSVVAYAASKGAVTAMTRAMAMDHAGENIRVNVVLPGSIDTPMLRDSASRLDPADPGRMIAEWGAGHPLGRVGWPSEVAAACVFLAGPGAAFITGSELRVDGGLTAGVSLAAPDKD